MNAEEIAQRLLEKASMFVHGYVGSSMLINYNGLKRKPTNFSCRMNFWHDSSYR